MEDSIALGTGRKRAEARIVPEGVVVDGGLAAEGEVLGRGHCGLLIVRVYIDKRIGGLMGQKRLQERKGTEHI